MEEQVVLLAMLVFNDLIAHLITIRIQHRKCHLEQFIILASQQVSLARHDVSLGFLIEFPLLHPLLEPVKGDVRINDSHDLAFIIMHRHTVGRYRILGTVCIIIRLAPAAAVLRYRVGEEGHLRIVMICRT